ncbi:hypothetical protein CRUP_032812 [Coryphaenoides rupestris]|nr:hypothetical protein CRUP_032812 [Coryphaenoides rupestris]
MLRSDVQRGAAMKDLDGTRRPKEHRSRFSLFLTKSGSPREREPQQDRHAGRRPQKYLGRDGPEVERVVRGAPQVPRLLSMAKQIYNIFIQSEAPKEVNIDHATRTALEGEMAHPTQSCFQAAQSKVYSLMQKDCYPRFLTSDLYLGLSRRKAPGGAIMHRRRSRSCVFTDRADAEAQSQACGRGSGGDGDKGSSSISNSSNRLLASALLQQSGQIAFREFLKSEYSEENILFWLACEEYKSIKSTPEMISSANRIYTEFVQTEAPRQINIDCGTRENITKNIGEPTLTSFDSAQKLIYSLMARDCYPRFLKSDVYQGLLRRTEPREGTLASSLQSRSSRKLSNRGLCFEEVTQWSCSLARLLESSYGMITFQAFLKAEFSDENLEFWLVCEDYKKVKCSFRLSAKARKIFKCHVQAGAPREINIDHKTRELVKRNLEAPSTACFREAQSVAYDLMERDSYPRFLRSGIYRTLLDSTSESIINVHHGCSGRVTSETDLQGEKALA